MLAELHIRNFAIIDELVIRFAPGLNVLTGETGAGKSIVIDAISAILGEKMGGEYVRSGSEAALVEATFELAEHNPTWRVLEEMGLSAEDGTLLMARELYPSGRSRCRVNGRSATVSMLRDIGEHLVDIHGQHEHQSLLKVDHHRRVLDATGDSRLQQARERVRASYRRWRDLQDQLARLRLDEREKARRIDLLAFQRNEITQAQLQPGEDVALQEERSRLVHAERLAQAATQAYGLLYGGLTEEGRSALDAASEAQRHLEDMARLDASLKPLLENLATAIYTLQDTAHELAAYQEKLEFNPARLDEIESRLELIQTLRRKYGSTIEEILAYGGQVDRELAEITRSEERQAELEQELAEVVDHLGREAAQLSELRRGAARRLEREVIKHLRDLRMEKVSFEVAFTRCPDENGVPVDEGRWAVTAEGIDQIEFLISPNPGEPLKPLAKIASGGEISRFMLALKSVLAAADQLPTLIFDEIDVGIGGATARAVGMKLAGLGRSKQVVCVTHLPQIASLAEAHYRIEKRPFPKRTRVEVTRLDEPGQLQEIGRMLGGEEVTEATLEHARELLRGRTG